MKTIANLTQHAASPEQLDAGVQNLVDDGNVIRALLTLSERELVAPAAELRRNLEDRASTLAGIASRLGYVYAMIGGHPMLMFFLGRALRNKGMYALIAVSERVSVDGPNGTKTSVFKHLGFCPWSVVSDTVAADQSAAVNFARLQYDGVCEDENVEDDDDVEEEV